MKSNGTSTDLSVGSYQLNYEMSCAKAQLTFGKQLTTAIV